MSNKTLFVFLGLQVLFMVTGIALLVVGVIFQPKAGMQSGPLDAGTNLLLSTIPLTGETLPERTSWAETDKLQALSRMQF